MTDSLTPDTPCDADPVEEPASGANDTQPLTGPDGQSLADALFASAGDDAADTPDDDSERDSEEQAEHDHDDALADEWGDESFPSSDPPGHY
ncbi:hypothetical protein [Brevibacterium litoralis]|uniref:hypothetical protein n=1 Tax=Brevibacterium litoralis TaxID=3138935 RepID=UPI0032EF3D5D